MLIDRDGPAAGASRGNAGLFATYAVTPELTPDLLRRLPGMLLDRHSPLSVRLRHLPRMMPWALSALAALRPESAQGITRALADLMQMVEGETAAHLDRAEARDLVRRRGALYVFRNRAAMLGAAAEWQLAADHGTRVETVDRSWLQELEPDLSQDFSGGYFLPDVQQTINPEHLVRRYFAYFLRSGGQFEARDILRLRDFGSQVSLVSADGESERFDAVVVACGIHSASLCRSLGLHVPLEAERGYNTTLPGAGIALNRPVCVAENGIYMSPMNNGLRIGGKVEFGGLRLAPRWSRADRMVREARAALPGLQTSGGKRWMGMRPSTPDSLPVIGPVPGHRRVHLAFGHGHLGLTLSAPTARIVADELLGAPPPIDTAPFRPGRFRRGA